MADNIVLSTNVGTGATVRTQEASGSVHYPVGLVAFGPDGGPYTEVSTSSGGGLPVQPSTGASFTVADGGGSITVDAPVGTPAFVRLSDGTAAITTLPVSLASVPSHAVTNAGTFAVQVDGAALTALQLLDDVVYADAATAGKGVLMMGAYSSLGEQAQAVKVDAAGQVFVTIADGNAVVSVKQLGAWVVDVGDGGGSLTVDGTVVATGDAAHDAAAGSLPVLLGAYASAAAPAAVSADGDAVRLWASRTGVLQVGDGGGTLSIDDGAGSVTVDAPVGTPVNVRVGDATNTAAVVAGDFANTIPSASASGLVTRAVLYAHNGSEEAAALTTSGGGLVVSDGGGSVTVDGTVAVSGTVTVGAHAVTQSGTWTVQPGNTANTTAWLVTGTGGTFPVTDSGGSLTVDAAAAAPLPVYLIDAAGGQSCMDTTNDALRVNIVAGAGSGGTAATDDAAFTAGTTSFTPVGGIVTSDSVDAGDGGAFAMLANRQQKVTLYDSSGVELSVGGGTQFAEDAAHTTGDKGTVAMAVRRDTPAVGSGTDGDYSTLNVDANGRLYVACDSHAVTNAGTFAVQAAQSGTWNVGTVTTVSAVTTVTTVTTCSTVTSLSQFAGNAIATNNGAASAGTLRVTLANDSTGVLATVSTVTTLTGGGVAHDAADSGNPHKVGAKAESSLSGITLVADGDRTDLYAGLDGVLIVRTDCNLEDVVQERATNTDGASTAFASGLAAPGAGIRLWVKSVTIANSSASFCTVDLRDGSAGSVLWTLPVPATGGVTHVFDPPLKLTANTALAFDASAATTTLTISANGFKSKL